MPFPFRRQIYRKNDKFIVLVDVPTRGVQNTFFGKVVPEGLFWEVMGQNDKFDVFTTNLTSKRKGHIGNLRS